MWCSALRFVFVPLRFKPLLRHKVIDLLNNTKYDNIIPHHKTHK